MKIRILKYQLLNFALCLLIPFSLLGVKESSTLTEEVEKSTQKNLSFPLKFMSDKDGSAEEPSTSSEKKESTPEQHQGLTLLSPRYTPKVLTQRTAPSLSQLTTSHVVENERKIVLSEVDEGLLTPRIPKKNKKVSSKGSPEKDLMQKPYDEGMVKLIDARKSEKLDSAFFQNLQTAIKKFEWAKKLGHPLAALCLGEVHALMGRYYLPENLRNDSPPESVTELDVVPPLSELTKAAQQFKLADKYNYYLGTEWYVRISFYIGEMLRSERFQGTNAMLHQEQDAFTNAASRGHAPAQYALAMLYLETDMTTALKWLRRAAKSGNAHAQGFLGGWLLENTPFLYEANFWLTTAKEKIKEIVLSQDQLNNAQTIEDKYQEALRMEKVNNLTEAAKLLTYACSYGHIPAGLKLARYYETQKMLENAFRVYRQLADQQDDEEAQCSLAQLLEKTDPKKAEEYYREAINNGYILAYFDLGLFLYQKKNIAEAQQCFESLILRLKTLTIEAQEYLSEASSLLNKPEEAKRWETGAETSKKSDHWYKPLADIDEEAETWFQEFQRNLLLDEDSKYSPLLQIFTDATLYLRQQKYLPAQKYFCICLVMLRNFAGQAFSNLGLLNESQAYFSTARAHFEAATTLRELNGQYNFALYLENEGQMDLAKRLYEEVASKGLVSAKLNRAIIAQQENESSLAETLYREVLASDPYCTEAMTNLGLLLHETNPDEAEVLYLRAAELNNPKAGSLLGNFYLQRGQPVKAKTYLMQAFQNGHVSAGRRLALLFQQEGNINAMLSWYRKAAAVGCRESQFHVARAYESLDDTGNAINFYKKAIAGGYIPAKRALGLLYLRIPDKASKIIGNSLLGQVESEENPGALFDLGNDAHFSTDQKINLETSIGFYKKAALKGHQKAIKKLYEIALEFETASLTDKSLLTQVYEGKTQVVAANIYLVIIECPGDNLPEIRSDALFRYGALLYESKRKQEGLKYINLAIGAGHEKAHNFLDEQNEK